MCKVALPYLPIPPGMDKIFLPTLPTYPISLDIMDQKFALREGVKNIQRGGGSLILGGSRQIPAVLVGIEIISRIIRGDFGILQGR